MKFDLADPVTISAPLPPTTQHVAVELSYNGDLVLFVQDGNGGFIRDVVSGADQPALCAALDAFIAGRLGTKLTTTAIKAVEVAPTPPAPPVLAKP